MQNNSFSDSRVGGGSVKSEKIVLMMSHMMSQQGVLGNFKHIMESLHYNVGVLTGWVGQKGASESHHHTSSHMQDSVFLEFVPILRNNHSKCQPPMFSFSNVYCKYMICPFKKYTYK